MILLYTDNLGFVRKPGNHWFKHYPLVIAYVYPIKQEVEGLGKHWGWKILNKEYEELKSGSCYKLKCAKSCAERESK